MPDNRAFRDPAPSCEDPAPARSIRRSLDDRLVRDLVIAAVDRLLDGRETRRVDWLDLDYIARIEEGRPWACHVEETDRRHADQMPPARALIGIDRGQCGGDRDRPCGHPDPRVGAPRQRQLGRQITQIGKAREKPDHVYVIAYAAVQRRHVPGCEPGKARHLCQIGGVLALITDRHPPEGGGTARLPLAIEQARDRILEIGPAGHQRIVVHHQRAKGRDGLNEARQPARAQTGIEAQDIVAERPVDPIAELGHEGTVPGGEETHCHRVPWYTAARLNGGHMANAINLNADMGEGFGAYDIGDDMGLLKVIRSASIACGFHAGDPVTMQRVVTQAVTEGVSIGAHPGFNDLWEFVRRRIDMDPRELEYMIAYQIGALQAMACYAGAQVTHLKPHGSLNNMAAENIDLALAIGRAIKTVDRDIIYVALAGSEMEKAGRELGLPTAREGFCDRLYDDDGNLTSRKVPGSVLKDPEVVKERVVRMVMDEEILSRHGKRLKVRLDTLCVHGDEPTGVIAARAAREGLEASGVRIVTLPEMVLG